MEENKERKQKVQRQNWKPHFLVRILYRTWRIGVSALKIAAGAIATVALIGIVCMFVFVNFLGDYLQEDIMSKAEMNLDDYELNKTSNIYCLNENGDIQILQQIYSTTDRRWASYEELPQALIEACVAIEDKRFYEHQGVDWITTTKACINMFMGDASFGGSTITQQLIKNLKLEQKDESADDVTVQRKVLEIFRAQAFEKKYDKEVVMEWYMNTVFFGESCYGVKSAAENYFGKELLDMTTAECAALIGITNNPSLFNPYSTKVFKYDGEETDGAGRNRTRQKKILTAMRDQGWLEEDAYLEAYNQEMVFKRGIAEQDKWTTCKDVFDKSGQLITKGCGYNGPVRDMVKEETDSKITYYCPDCGKVIDITKDASQSVYSWYVDQVLEDVAKAMAERDGVTEWNKNIRELYMQRIGHGGYHIYTPYNPTVQAAVDKIYTDLEQIPTVKNGQQLQSGIVILDNRTGDIVAMAGGVGEKTDFDAYNRATDAKLQTGSSIKPLTVYGPAFELGIINPATVVDDLPISFNNKNPFPRNDNRQYNYTRTIWRGIVSSVNAICVNTLDMIGTQYSFNFVTEKFGISTLVDNYTTSSGAVLSDIGYAPLGMGALTFGATVRDMTCAYGTFANGGTWREGRVFTKVYDSDGKLVLDNEQDSRTILGNKAVNYMNYCLDSAVASGTGTAADLYKDLGMDVAGKTGSTQNFKDRYFVGFTGYYTAAVWCGFDIPEEIIMTGVTTNPAARLWKKVMLQLHEGKETIPLYDTTGMIQVSVCLDSGKLATSACYNDIRGKNLSRVQSGVWVYPEDAPTQECDKHISMNFCTAGNSTANEWCHKFQQVGQIQFTQKSLVKMTQDRIDDLLAVKGKGLVSGYLSDNYVYLVDKNGNDLPFFGFTGKINQGLNVPYKCCTLHTQEAWEQFKLENPWVPDDL